MQGLEVADADLTTYIHPSKENKVRHAVLRQLSSLLFTYNDIFDGILLAFEVSIQGRKAKILPGLVPYFGVKLRATLLLFSPKPDMLLETSNKAKKKPFLLDSENWSRVSAVEGKVVKLGKESINLIVLGFCSAAIMSDDIRDEFKYKIKEGAGVYASKSHKRHAIRDGSIVRFLVKSLDEEILHISGSLIPTDTGCVRWLSKHGVEDGTRIDRSINGHRDVKKEVEDQHPGLSTEAYKPAGHDRQHKSRKRKVEA